MNPAKDIKVTFLSNTKLENTEKIRLFFKDIFGNDVQIDLRPGEIVYSQTDSLSNSLKIYSKKGIISIQNENKPYFLEYYVGYKEEDVDNKHFLFNLKKALEKPLAKDAKLDNAKNKKISIRVPKKTIEPQTQKVEPAPAPAESNETIIEKAIKEVNKYSEKKKLKSKSSKGPGRPKKRGPKKGSKRKKAEEDPFENRIR